MTVSLILLEILPATGPAVTGDSTVASYPGHIAVESFNWGVKSEPRKGSGNGNLAPIVKPQTLTVKKQFDRASTVLYTMMEGDKPFTATLRFIDPSTSSRSASGSSSQVDSVLEVELKGCHIESIGLNIDDGGKTVSASETLVLSFEESAMLSYRMYDASSRMRSKAMSASVYTPTNDGSGDSS
ncbi:MAG: type VI secretion system tube protein Hcp [Pelomonas sp.]|nr:type VI secretion system tube protein Hcp [Roseateles sp.]